MLPTAHKLLCDPAKYSRTLDRPIHVRNRGAVAGERRIAGALASAQLRMGAAVIDLTRGAPAAIKMTGDTLRRLLSPAFPAAETEQRAVAAETAAANIDGAPADFRSNDFRCAPIDGARAVAATGTLHIAGAASELASGATRNLRGNAAGSLARI